MNVNHTPTSAPMDLLTFAGVLMLALWAVGTWAFEAPGLIHGLLTLGVFFVVLGAIKRSERARKAR